MDPIVPQLRQLVVELRHRDRTSVHFQYDFVGADMARKFLQMGYTRARRYANYKGCRKYDKDADSFKLKERGTGDPQKAESAAIFYELWKKAEQSRVAGAGKAKPRVKSAGLLTGAWGLGGLGWPAVAAITPTLPFRSDRT
jgi:hypothetical protein